MEEGGIRKLIAAAIVLIALAVAAVIGVYFWQHHQVSNLQADNRQLQSSITSLRNTNQQLNQNLQSRQQNQGQSAENQTDADTYQSAKGVKVTIYSPASGSKVATPVAVIGLVPGNWSFEASFPVKLEDGTGKVIAQTTGHVLGPWMTSQPVPFSAQLTYTGSPSGSGTLVLEKDNPSDLASNQDSVTVPVKF